MVTAVMRTVAVNAARGQVRSQQLFTKMLSETEQARAVQIERVFNAAAKYTVE
jgi:N-acetylglutamate synthase-like GNAT family acetyltransferase